MDRIWHFLALRDVEAADRVEAAIRTRVRRLLQFPLLGRWSERLGARELSLVDLQYRVAYVVEEDRVLISAVRHTRESA